LGRGSTYELRDAVSLAKSSNPEKWKNVIFNVFDLPKSNEPFEARMEQLKNLPKYPQVKIMQYH
jgi:hypothetical protein